MDRGAWRATVYGVAESQTQLKQLSTRRPGKLFLYRRGLALPLSPPGAQGCGSTSAQLKGRSRGALLLQRPQL